MICDMCGSPGKLFKTIVEGAELTLCHECSKFGKVIDIIKENQIGKESIESEIKTIAIIVDNYAEKIREKRQILGLKQEEFAKKINEKESLMQKIESGNFVPSMELAKKIESFLKIKLIEEHEETNEKQAKAKTGTFTIGDFIKIKEK